MVARVCLDMLRSRRARREVPLIRRHSPAASLDPEQEAMLADSVGLALLVVLNTLTPAERLAFVLHDMFAVPFHEITPIVGRSTQATKMLASRARHRVRAAEARDLDAAPQRQVVDAFLAASRMATSLRCSTCSTPTSPYAQTPQRNPQNHHPLARGRSSSAAGARVLAPSQGCPERIRQRPSSDPGDTSRAPSSLSSRSQSPTERSSRST